jgi:hypothetical protein
VGADADVTAHLRELDRADAVHAVLVVEQRAVFFVVKNVVRSVRGVLPGVEVLRAEPTLAPSFSKMARPNRIVSCRL